MEAKELRIGNWVEHNSEWFYRGEDVYQFQWSERDWYALGGSTLYLENVEPIPLTEEWLLKFGFEYKEETECYHYSSLIINKLFIMMDIDIRVYIKYVHQLQNLYFVLTGEELKLKNPTD